MRLHAFTGCSFDELKRCNQCTGLVVKGMLSGFDTPDHPGLVVLGKRPQNFSEFIGSFLLRNQSDLYLHGFLSRSFLYVEELQKDHLTRLGKPLFPMEQDAKPTGAHLAFRPPAMCARSKEEAGTLALPALRLPPNDSFDEVLARSSPRNSDATGLVR